MTKLSQSGVFPTKFFPGIGMDLCPIGKTFDTTSRERKVPARRPLQSDSFRMHIIIRVCVRPHAVTNEFCAEPASCKTESSGHATDKNVHRTSNLAQLHCPLRLCQELTQVIRDFVAFRQFHLFGIDGPADVCEIKCPAMPGDFD